MLWKQDDKRPTTSQILNMEFVQKYLNELVKTKGTALKNVRLLDREATATASMLKKIKLNQEELKEKVLTPKEKANLRKQEDVKKREKDLAKGAKNAFEVLEQ
jgi:hypothetical protein